MSHLSRNGKPLVRGLPPGLSSSLRFIPLCLLPIGSMLGTVGSVLESNVRGALPTR